MRLFKRKASADPATRCPDCGERMPDGAHKCAMCGHDLGDGAEDQSPRVIELSPSMPRPGRS